MSSEPYEIAEQPPPRNGDSLTLVIPYFGDPDLLLETISSVLGQDDPDWALLIVEDGDQGHDVRGRVESLADDRVQYLANEVTLGVAANFQRCLEAATTAWVAFPGCDDVLEPSYVRAVRREARSHPDVWAVHPATTVIDGRGVAVLPLVDRVKSWLRPDPGIIEGDRALALLLHGNWAYFPSICWHREQIRAIGFRPDLPVTLDLALLAEVLLRGGKIALTDTPGLRYRRHAASASSVAARDAARFVEERRLFREIADAARRRGYRRSVRAADWHLTSRAHSALLGAKAAARGDLSRGALLARLALGPASSQRAAALTQRSSVD